MTRVIGGRLGGRRLAAPPGRDTRPTSDRVREALFNSLAGAVPAARFADLYAGSGAVGIEALSRGAAHALFVESSPKAARVLRENLAALGVAASAHVVTAPVAKALAGGPAQPYDVVFADPPYALPDAELTEVLEALASGGWIAEDGIVVVERSSRTGAPAWARGLTESRSRRYGETTLWYGRAS